MTKQQMRVTWIPQVGYDAEMVIPVKDVFEGVKIMEVLANYDLFQYENRIKPDYSNMGFLEVYEDGEWCDWGGAEYEGKWFDNPKEYVEWVKTINGEWVEGEEII